jgi:hypothetical protein
MTVFPGYSVAVLLVSIMIAISGIAMGLGYAADEKKLKEFGRSELQQAIISGALVGSLFVAFSQYGIVSAIINGLTSNMQLQASCPGSMASNYALCFAHNYLVGSGGEAAGYGSVTVNGQQQEPLFYTVTNLLLVIGELRAALGALAGISVNLALVSINPSYLISPLISMLNEVLEALGAAATGIWIQGMLLSLIAASALPVLLPIGIVLRTLYPTRRLGGAILAITIGLFTVLPMTYVLNIQLMNGYIGQYSPEISAFTAYQQKASGLLGSILNLVSLGSLGFGKSAASVGNILNDITFLISNINQAIVGLVDYISALIIEVFILPIFSIILTIISIRELARVLGSEVSLSRFDIF